MTMRALAFVLALLVAGAPIALDACRMTCAWSMTDAGANGASRGHSCRHQSLPARATISPMSHSCGHTDELLASPTVTSATPFGIELPAGVIVVHEAIIDVHHAPGSARDAVDSAYHADAGVAIPLRI